MRFVVVLLLASCGSGDRALEDGDRLHLRYWAYEDGTKQWDPTTYFDTALDAECRPLPWSDGLTYCTPDTLEVAYRDDACAKPVGFAEGRTFVRKFTMASERRPSRMYRATDHHVGLDAYWMFDGTACVGPFAGGDFVEVDEVAAVRIDESAPTGDGRVRATTWSTDDGLSAPARFIDTLADSTCVPSPAADGGFECLPTNVIETTVFRDAACTQRLAVVHDTRSGEPFPLVVRTGCGEYFHRGPEVLNFPAYVNSADGCVEIELDPYQITFELGERFPVAQLAQRRAGEARLRPIELDALPTTIAYDSMFDVACEPAAGFGTRCLPRMANGRVSDLARTSTCDALEPFVVAERTTCKPVRFTISQRDRNPVIRLLSEPYGDALYTSVDGACVPAIIDGDVYASNTIVPIEAFAAATRE
jgi:hypothetical protein